MADRRQFLKNSLGLAAGVALANSSSAFEHINLGKNAALRFEVEPLPYAYDALVDVIDAKTMQIHHDLHYGAYVKNANEALEQEKVQVKNVNELFAQIDKYSAKLRNNAGGAYNHALFWKVMRKPQANNAPTGALAKAIDRDFGGFEQFKEQFAKAAASQFGSGWAWLIVQNGKLKITATANQDNPLMGNQVEKGKPILGLDVWEHAYYLQYQNKRPDYIKNWWSVVNWDVVAKSLNA
ncbi:superoxide dismutase [Sphingobacterium sp. Mn56C]|uniref:superoxide dismutase n=1 Tax=Sphingobacterium sp. Mn56C TaxID=3395261 RepID=UPI003BE5BAA3